LLVYKLEDSVTKAFKEISSNNPLRQLNPSEKKTLILTLMVYVNVKARDDDASSDDFPIERVAKSVAAAAKYGANLESEVFAGPFSEELRPFIIGFEDLPKRLVEFSNTVSAVLNLMGKPGHKEENFATQLLVIASEFVRLRTGYYHDEHLAELLRFVTEGRLSRDLSDDEILWGEAIRKKRAYLKNQYAQLYAKTVEMAETACRNSTPVNP
jgi:hypothetical protein